MNPKDFFLTIIDRYLEQELIMASLYERFANHFTTHKKFWVSMVSEEHEHAGWIRHFKDGIIKDSFHFSEGKTRIAALDSTIAYIKAKICEFDEKPFELKKALSICLDIEKSLIERNVFKRFECDSPDLNKILEVLSEAQEEHIKKVEQVISTI